MPITKKKGGGLVDDVNNLAVPFGLLLAERGLSNLMKKSNPTKKKAASDAAALDNNKRAAVGGAKATKTTKAKKTTKGGSPMESTVGSKKLVDEFSKLSSEIETFLAKY